MQIHLIQQALRELLMAPRTASSVYDVTMRRIAVRWLQAGESLQYDIMIRLQLLEGAAGVPFRTWFAKGARGLVEAAKHFDQSGPVGDWFSPKDTGSFTLLRNKIALFIRQRSSKSGVRIDPMEVIHSGLFGVPLDPSEEYTNKYKLHSVGHFLKNQIPGEESPKQVISGMGSFGFLQIVKNEVAKVERHRGFEKDFGEEEKADVGVNVADEKILDPDEIWPYLAFWISDASDPLGQQLRNLMLKSWAGWRGGEGMKLWLEDFMRTKSAPNQKEIAGVVGVSVPSWTVNYWQPGWARFVGVLKSQSKLAVEIERRFLSMGYTDVEIDFSKIPNPEDISPKRIKDVRPKPTVKLASYPIDPPF